MSKIFSCILSDFMVRACKSNYYFNYYFNQFNFHLSQKWLLRYNSVIIFSFTVNSWNLIALYIFFRFIHSHSLHCKKKLLNIVLILCPRSLRCVRPSGGVSIACRREGLKEVQRGGKAQRWSVRATEFKLVLNDHKNDLSTVFSFRRSSSPNLFPLARQHLDSSFSHARASFPKRAYGLALTFCSNYDLTRIHRIYTMR